MIHILIATPVYLSLQGYVYQRSCPFCCGKTPILRSADHLEDTGLPLYVHENFLVELAVRRGDLGGKSLVRYPFGGGPGGGLLHHLVDLLQRQPFGLRDEEVGVNEGRCAQATPDEEDG